jgi:hypothetical protein
MRPLRGIERDSEELAMHSIDDFFLFPIRRFKEQPTDFNPVRQINRRFRLI